MNLLSEIQGRLLVMMPEGLRPGRIRIPIARREELELQMRRSQGARRSNEVPLHIMGVMLYFERDRVEIE